MIGELGQLALCFALSVMGRGLGESFTVFLKPISESFGWDRAQVVSVYSLSALAGGLASPLLVWYATTNQITLSGPILVVTVVGLAIFLVAVLLSPETKGKVLIADLSVA